MPEKCQTWWTFRIFFIFSRRGGGRGSPRRRGWGFFLLKIPGGAGGGSRRVLAFFDFLAFFVFRFSAFLGGVFPFFSKNFRDSAKRKTLAFFGVSLAVFRKSKGWRIRDW